MFLSIIYAEFWSSVASYLRQQQNLEKSLEKTFRNFFNFKKCMGYLAPNYNDIYTVWFSHDIQNNYSWIHPPTGK